MFALGTHTPASSCPRCVNIVCTTYRMLVSQSSSLILAPFHRISGTRTTCARYRAHKRMVIVDSRNACACVCFLLMALILIYCHLFVGFSIAFPVDFDCEIGRHCATPEEWIEHSRCWVRLSCLVAVEAVTIPTNNKSKSFQINTMKSFFSSSAQTPKSNANQYRPGKLNIGITGP